MSLLNAFLSTLILQSNDTSHLLFRSERIYAVLGVVLIIWVGIIVLLIRQDRKVSRLEKQLREKHEEQA